MDSSAQQQQNEQANSTNLKPISSYLLSKCIDEEDGCELFDLGCPSSSKQNKNVLKSEKLPQNEKQFVLSSSKRLFIQERHQQIVNESQKPTLETPKQFQPKSTAKGIRLSLTNKNASTVQTGKKLSSYPYQQKIIPDSNSHQQTKNQTAIQQKEGQMIFNFAIQERQTHAYYHQLSPLSIKQNKNSQKDVHLGPYKSFHQTRTSRLPQVHIVGPKKIQFGPYNVKNITSPGIKLQTFRDISQSFCFQASSFHFNYISSTSKADLNTEQRRYGFLPTAQKSCSHNNRVKKNQVNQRTQTFDDSVYLAQSFRLQFRQNSSKTVEERNFWCDQSYQYLTDKKYAKTGNPNMVKIDQKDDQFDNKSIQAYSDRYRQYMSKQLGSPVIQSIFQADRTEYESVNQDQNQKSQNQIPGIFLKIKPLPETRRSLRKGSYSSSFVVVQSREKQIESTKNIYLPSQDGSSSIADHTSSNQKLQSFFQDQITVQHPNTDPNTHNQAQNLYQNGQIRQQQIFTELQGLIQTHKSLMQQQRLLKFQLQCKVLERKKQFSQKQSQLQALKLISEQRGHQIEHLRQFVKVKRIYQQIQASVQLKDKYLQDQAGWSRQICQEANFDEKISYNQSTLITNSRSDSITLRVK